MVESEPSKSQPQVAAGAVTISTPTQNGGTILGEINDDESILDCECTIVVQGYSSGDNVNCEASVISNVVARKRIRADDDKTDEGRGRAKGTKQKQL